MDDREQSPEASRIIVADSHTIVRDGLRRILQLEPGLRVVGEAATGQTAVELVRRLQPDLLLLGFSLRGLSGLDVVRALGGDADRQLLADAVHACAPAEKSFGLTIRELDIITVIVSGACNKEIAQRLNISDLTVKRHLTNIYGKVGVTGRLELALFSLAHNLGSIRKPASGVPSSAALRNAHLHSFAIPS